jgi:hypothetical protein
MRKGPAADVLRTGPFPPVLWLCPYKSADGSGGDALVLVLELPDLAVGGVDVVTFAPIDRLVDAAALRKSVEEPNLHDLTRFRDVVIGRDGDVAGGHVLVAVEEDERDAAALFYRRSGSADA